MGLCGLGAFQTIIMCVKGLIITIQLYTTKHVVMVTDTQLLTQSLLQLNVEGEVSLLSVTMVILVIIAGISKFIF